MRCIGLTGSFLAALAFSGCAGLGGGRPPRAPMPMKSINLDRFYSGRWYEIARTPMKLTKGCVAGATDYYRDREGRLIDRDSCRAGTPEGKEKVFEGPVTDLNPGDNTKITVHYRVARVLSAPRTYWILDHGDGYDYDWFIVADPSMKTLSIFTRAPEPTAGTVKALTARAEALGYDTDKLEYPAEFAPGAGQAPPDGFHR